MLPLDSPLETDLDTYVALAHRLADRAAEVIRQHFRIGLEAEDKEDGSPVTIADRRTEEAMRAILAEVVPDDGIIGEELGREREGADTVWVLDPIDGTKAFIAGKPLFVTLVAVLHRGRPILGVINQPITHERWVGALGRPTLFHSAVHDAGTPCWSRACAEVRHARVSTTGPQYFSEAGGRAFGKIAAQSALLSYGGDGYQYGLVAMGALDLVVEAGLKVYDWAALAPIVDGAGGLLTDWQGNAPTVDGPGEIVAAGDVRCHAEALRLLSAPAELP